MTTVTLRLTLLPCPSGNLWIPNANGLLQLIKGCIKDACDRRLSLTTETVLLKVLIACLQDFLVLLIGVVQETILTAVSISRG